MSQTKVIVEGLKRELKAQGKTYLDVANVLDLSEASVKRLFSTANLSLHRLDRLCQMLSVDLVDLLGRGAANSGLKRLSRDQEQQLVDQPELLLVAVCAVNRWTYQEIIETYNLGGAQVIGLLAKLDRLKLIELLPNNRIKLMVDREFRWIASGPIQNFFRSHIKDDYFATSFNGRGEIMLFQNAMLSRSAISVMVRKMEALAKEFQQLAAEDSKQPLAERFGSSVLLSMRPWEIKCFRDLRRPGTEKIF
jgi:DNA-binding Xre family transcriptional regulator